jgi:hypothetical protein
MFYLSLTTGGTATFSDENVATGKTVILAEPFGADADNYNLTSTTALQHH